MAKQFYACNWAPSRVTEEQLNGMVNIGTLPKKNWDLMASSRNKESSYPKAGWGSGLCRPHRPWFQTARVEVFPRCSCQFPTPSSRYRTQLGVQSMQLPSLLWSVLTRRTNCWAVPRLFSSEPAYKICKWSKHWTWWCLCSKAERSWIPSCQTA